MDYAHVVFMVGQGKLQPTIPPDCPTDVASLMMQCWSINLRRRPTIDRIVEMLPIEDEITHTLLNTF